MAKPQLILDSPFAVALGFGSTEAQFTYAAADSVMALKWKADGSGYECFIVDTGFLDESREQMDEGAKDHWHGDASFEVAAALMFLCVAADMLNVASQPDPSTTQREWDDTTNKCYDLVEAWLKLYGISNNLRPIP